MTELHPWIKNLTSAEADALVRACAHKAVKLAGHTTIVSDELESQAYLLLVECARKVEDDTYSECQQCGKGLRGRRNAKFCGPTCRKAYNRAHPNEAPAAPRAGFIGSMWTWQPERMEASAILTVAHALANMIRMVESGEDAQLIPVGSSASVDILAERVQSPLRMGADPLDVVIQELEGRDLLWFEFGVRGKLLASLDGTEHRLLWATEAYPFQGLDLPGIGAVVCAWKTDNNGRRQ